MGKNEQLKAQTEQAAGDRFIEEYNKENNSQFVFKKKGERPALVYSDNSNIIGVEVTIAYYNENDAKGSWDIARGKTSSNSSGLLVNPDEQLAQHINKDIKAKCTKHYDFPYPIILLVATRPALTQDEQDFQDNVLPHIKLPDDIPYCEIYLYLSLPPQHHFYRLYP